MSKYTKVGPFTNNSVTPPIDKTFLDGVEAALVPLNIPAPAPSGGDDTATLQALLNTAQTTGGTLILQAGTYLANLATAQSFTQPRIIGQGMNLTILKGYVNTSPVLRMKGGSGGMSGGHIADLSIAASTAGGGVGLQIADANGVRWNRIHFTGTLAEGIEFWNESAGGFAEYNSGDAIFEPAVVLPVRYRVTGGNASFHGSGLTEGSIVNQAASAGPVVQIDSGAFPYASPMTVAIFPRTAGGTLFVNNATNYQPSFYGHLDVEVQVTGPVYAGGGAGARIFYRGTAGGLASSNLKLGTMYLVDKLYYVGTSVFATYKPLQRATTLAAGTTAVFPDQIGTCLIQIDIVGSNYHYAYALKCWQSPYNSGGTVSVLSTDQTLNTAGYGAPTFAWTNYGLTVTNASYSSSVTAYVSVQPLNNPVGSDVFGQG